MVKVHFSNIIYFLARIDQQAEIYHSRLSKQDIIKKKQKKRQTKQKQKNSNRFLDLVFS